MMMKSVLAVLPFALGQDSEECVRGYVLGSANMVDSAQVAYCTQLCGSVVSSGACEAGVSVIDCVKKDPRCAMREAGSPVVEGGDGEATQTTGTATETQGTTVGTSTASSTASDDSTVNTASTGSQASENTGTESDPTGTVGTGSTDGVNSEAVTAFMSVSLASIAAVNLLL